MDWANTETKYRVANPLLAMYYRKVLEQRRGLSLSLAPIQPVSCADLLMRAIPYLTFSKVTGYPPGIRPQSPLSSDMLPYENQYNAAIIAVLMKLNFEAGSISSTRKGFGTPDVFVRMGGHLYVMEGIKAASGLSEHQKHRNRFDTLQCYKEASHKALYTIGNMTTVLSNVRETRAEGVEIIGLAPNIAHTGYTVLVRPADSENGSEPLQLFVECDLVARSLKIEGKNMTVCSVQKFEQINPPTSGAMLL